MPTYDFACNNCGHEFELFFARFINDDDDTACPECGSTDVKQSMTSFNMMMMSGSTGKGNCGPRMDSKPSLSSKYMKYRDPKYRRK